MITKINSYNINNQPNFTAHGAKTDMNKKQKAVVLASTIAGSAPVIALLAHKKGFSLNPKQILSSLESQVKKLNLIELSSIKTEIQKLILLYKDLKGLIKEKSKVGDKFFQQTLNLSVNLSGYTPFGVNGMTAIL